MQTALQSYEIRKRARDDASRVTTGARHKAEIRNLIKALLIPNNIMAKKKYDNNVYCVWMCMSVCFYVRGRRAETCLTRLL